MEAPARAEGLVAGCSCVHVWPSQTHVSPNQLLKWDPPKSTSWPVPGSYAMDAPPRADGLDPGLCWLQVAFAVVALAGRAALNAPTVAKSNATTSAATKRAAFLMVSSPSINRSYCDPSPGAYVKATLWSDYL